MPFAGVLLAESLRTGAVLEGVPFLVQRVRRFDAGDPSAGQPRTWTFIEFVVADASAGLFADRAAAALAPGPWYCDLRNGDEVVVELRSGREGDEQHELAEPPAADLLDVDDEAVGDLREPLDHGVEVAGPEAHAAAVQRGVGAARDHAGAFEGERQRAQI